MKFSKIFIAFNSKIYEITYPIGLETTSSTCGSGLDSKMMLYTSSKVAPCSSLPFHSNTSSPIIPVIRLLSKSAVDCTHNDNLSHSTVSLLNCETCVVQQVWSPSYRKILSIKGFLQLSFKYVKFDETIIASVGLRWN